MNKYTIITSSGGMVNHIECDHILRDNVRGVFELYNNEEMIVTTPLTTTIILETTNTKIKNGKSE